MAVNLMEFIKDIEDGKTSIYSLSNMDIPDSGVFVPVEQYRKPLFLGVDNAVKEVIRVEGMRLQFIDTYIIGSIDKNKGLIELTITNN